MKKTFRFFKPFLLLTSIALTAIACDEDFVNVESDISGIQNFEVNTIEYPITSYTQRISNAVNGVQSDELSSNLLGVYKDPNTIFGTTTASVVTQVVPTSVSPEFGESPTLTSVTLRIPYFSTLISTDVNGDNTYELDSVFGNIEAPIKLSIYKNNYVLRDLDPDTNFEEKQKYYSSQEALFTSQMGELLYTNDNFIFDNSEFPIQEVDDEGELVFDDEDQPVIAERLVPALSIDLDNPSSFWENTFLNNEDNEAFDNITNFKDFFRGLIFKVEQEGNDGAIAMLNFSNGNITINYTNITTDDDGVETVNDETYTLNFNGNRVNTFVHANNTYMTGDSTNGDDQLLIKGGDGAFAVVDLFSGIDSDNNGLSDNLEEFQSRKDSWLINEAHLTVYVDQNAVLGDEPDRILIYDLKNNIPIVDYQFDGTTNLNSPQNSKIYHSELLERDDDDNGVKYKFRLTEHVNNVLLRDSTNIKLGLFVTTNINEFIPQQIQGVAQDTDASTIDQLPISSILSPKGTLLYGSTPSVPENVRAKFEVFYTESQN